MNNIIPLFVLIPLAAAFVVTLLPRAWRSVPDVLGNGVLAVLTGMALSVVGQTGIFHLGGWQTPLGIDLRLDGLSVLLLAAVNTVGLAATLFSVAYMRDYTATNRYYALFLFMVAGMNGVVLTGDMFNLFVFMEIAAISSYALVAFGCEHEELEAAFKYAILGSVASAFILIGVAIFYAELGTLNMAHGSTKIAARELDSPLLFALGLFICGFGLKAALVPFHAWLPDAHPSAPAPVSAMLSGVVIKALGLYVLARLIFNVFGTGEQVLAILRWLGVVSMIVGVLLAIGQWDMKRLFAYHSISQIGYVALGLGLGTPLGIAGGLFHLVNHSVFKSLLFLNAGAVEHATGTRQLKRLGGLYGRMPVTGKTSLVASMSIAGIPPFNGFWSKLLIVLACVESGRHGLGLAAVLVSLVTLASFLKVQKFAFFRAAPPGMGQVREVPVLMRTSMLLLAALCLGMSLLVMTGLRTPYIIGPAVQALENVFEFAPH